MNRTDEPAYKWAQIAKALDDGITDILTFNCGRRPNVTEQDIMAMALNRFKRIANA
jgi:hypothetical protein